jgi:thiol-disulfide isomerase/thioredoxin
MTAGRIGMALAGAAALLAIALTVRSAPSDRRTDLPASVNLDITLKDGDGGDVSLTRFAGRPLLINLWATWCAPCRLETPQLVDLYAKYKDRGLVVLGISIDDTAEQIRAFAKEFGVTYPMLVGRDHPEFLAALGYSGPVPMSVFVRPDGRVSTRVTGIDTTAAMERRLLLLFE